MNAIPVLSPRSREKPTWGRGRCSASAVANGEDASVLSVAATPGAAPPGSMVPPQKSTNSNAAHETKFEPTHRLVPATETDRAPPGQAATASGATQAPEQRSPAGPAVLLARERGIGWLAAFTGSGGSLRSDWTLSRTVSSVTSKFGAVHSRGPSLKSLKKSNFH